MHVLEPKNLPEAPEEKLAPRSCSGPCAAGLLTNIIQRRFRTNPAYCPQDLLLNLFSWLIILTSAAVGFRMEGMRVRRLKVIGSSGVYHCMSRVAGGEALLGDIEKEVFRRQLWQLADFCGVEVLTYCVMSNHFHLLVRVPPEQESRQVSDAELERRLRGLYRREQAEAWVSRLRGEEREATRERLLGRMGDVSVYLKELKQRFSIWYNRTHNRYGTLWAERFKSVLVEPTGRALLTVACYIDLNPVRAGLCGDPKEYRFCGYAEAVAGGEGARGGLLRVMEQKDWRGAGREYRLVLLGKGYYTEAGGAAGVPGEKLAQAKRRGGELSLSEQLRCRVRYFTAGAAIGSREYVGALMRERVDFVGAGRRTGPSRMRAPALKELYSLRGLRREPVGPPPGLSPAARDPHCTKKPAGDKSF